MFSSESLIPLWDLFLWTWCELTQEAGLHLDRMDWKVSPQELVSYQSIINLVLQVHLLKDGDTVLANCGDITQANRRLFSLVHFCAFAFSTNVYTVLSNIVFLLHKTLNWSQMTNGTNNHAHPVCLYNTVQMCIFACWAEVVVSFWMKSRIIRNVTQQMCFDVKPGLNWSWTQDVRGNSWLNSWWKSDDWL